jgi:hypothetical protein
MDYKKKQEAKIEAAEMKFLRLHKEGPYKKY